MSSTQSPSESAPQKWPDVDVVLSAYNEEVCIHQRVENLLAQDYQGQLRILVASDGSADRTGEIISAFDDPRVVALDFKENRGKVAVLNDLVSRATADVLVFTDANTDFEPDAITRLVSTFDDSTGAVCGELHLHNDAGGQNSDGLYWRYEQFLKKSESNLGALLGANGAVYAIRRALYEPLSTDTVVDDFCIVMNVKKQGYDVVYNDNARAREEVAPTLSDEYGRRVRIGLGNYRALVANTWALSPFRGVLSWCFWSHKVLRWFGPHLMLAAFVSNALLISDPFYLLTFTAQVIFYATAWLGTKAINQDKKVNKLIAIVSFFVSMNVALGHGFIKFLNGNQSGAWARTARQGESNK